MAQGFIVLKMKYKGTEIIFRRWQRRNPSGR